MFSRLLMYCHVIYSCLLLTIIGDFCLVKSLNSSLYSSIFPLAKSFVAKICVALIQVNNL